MARVAKKLLKAMGGVASGEMSCDGKKRIAQYKKLAPWLPKTFNETTWLNDAIETEVEGLRDSKDGILSSFTIFRDKYFWRD